MAKITILRAEVDTEELTAMARVALDAQPQPVVAEILEAPAAPALPEPNTRGHDSESCPHPPADEEPPRKKVPPVTVVRQRKPQAKAKLDERACDWCEVLFTPRAKNQRFCAPECSKAWHAAQSSAKKTPHLPEVQA